MLNHHLFILQTVELGLPAQLRHQLVDSFIAIGEYDLIRFPRKVDILSHSHDRPEQSRLSGRREVDKASRNGRVGFGDETAKRLHHQRSAKHQQQIARAKIRIDR